MSTYKLKILRCVGYNTAYKMEGRRGMHDHDRLKKYLTGPELDAIDKLVAELRKTWPDVKVKVFGSKVKGFADEESDIDLLILLPGEVTEEMRRQIIHKVFHINLQFETNISPLILSRKEWEDSPISVLPIHHYVEEEGISL